jgi:subtilase family serine protease
MLAPFASGCGTLQQASIVLPNLTAGVHSIRIQVDPENQISETSKANNVLTVSVLVGSYGIYLPTMQR